VSEEPSGGVVEPPDSEPPGREVAVREEKTRGRITTGALVIFGGTVLLSFIGVFLGMGEDVWQLLQIVIPIEGTLIGGVAGYYLGTGNQA
jgi:hypothetical protein